MTLALSSTGMAPTASRTTGTSRHRVLLVSITVALLAGSLSLGLASQSSTVEPDLARLLRFMALLKGSFAVAALVAGYWRLGRPVMSWREPVYLLGPGLIGAGAIGLWFLQSAGFATLVLHVGLFAFLAAALTDEHFLPTRQRSKRMTGR